MPPVTDEYDDDAGYSSAPRLALLHDFQTSAASAAARPPSSSDHHIALPPMPATSFSAVDFDPPPTPTASTPLLPPPPPPPPSSHSRRADHDLDDDELPPIHPTLPESEEDSDESEHDEDEDLAVRETLNYFVHNGYRYDGDVFQLRPPQERSIASRPERILEHKPPLLSNRQTFNRVYSEGTYNARPSSLRQPRRTSSRFSTSSAASSDADDPSPARIDNPATNPPPLPVTRPPSVRPPAVRPPGAPLSPTGLCRTIEEVRQNASFGAGNQNLKGLLAYSAVPVTRISGDRPDLLGSKCGNVQEEPVEKEVRVQKVLPVGTGVVPVVEECLGPVDDELPDENQRPHVVREKRGRSYTSFAKNTPYGRPSDARRSGKLPAVGGGPAPQKRTSFWKLLSR